MPTYIFLDFENVQPQGTDWKDIPTQNVQVRLYHGPQQKKFDASLVKALQRFGTAVEYIECERRGSNALDFRMAFELGGIVNGYAGKATDRDRPSFVIVTRDRGLDSLVQHVQALGFDAKRVESVGHMEVGKDVGESGPAAKPKASAARTPEILERIVDVLRDGPKNRPKSLKTLKHHISAMTRESDEPAIEKIIEALKKRGILKEEAGKISYRFKD